MEGANVAFSFYGKTYAQLLCDEELFKSLDEKCTPLEILTRNEFNMRYFESIKNYMMQQSKKNLFELEVCLDEFFAFVLSLVEKYTPDRFDDCKRRLQESQTLLAKVVRADLMVGGHA